VNHLYLYFSEKVNNLLFSAKKKALGFNNRSTMEAVIKTESNEHPLSMKFPQPNFFLEHYVIKCIFNKVREVSI
jgi:hypothetical protein